MRVMHLRRLVSAAVLLAVVASVSACGLRWSTDPVAEQVDLPGMWDAIPDTYTSADVPVPEPLPFMTLQEDGTAEVSNLPMGRLGERDSYRCFVPSGELYSGPATWSATPGGLLQVDAEETTVFWADTGYMGSLYWVELRLAECGTEPMVSFGGPPSRARD